MPTEPNLALPWIVRHGVDIFVADPDDCGLSVGTFNREYGEGLLRFIEQTRHSLSLRGSSGEFYLRIRPALRGPIIQSVGFDGRLITSQALLGLKTDAVVVFAPFWTHVDGVPIYAGASVRRGFPEPAAFLNIYASRLRTFIASNNQEESFYLFLLQEGSGIFVEGRLEGSLSPLFREPLIPSLIIAGIIPEFLLGEGDREQYSVQWRHKQREPEETTWTLWDVGLSPAIEVTTSQGRTCVTQKRDVPLRVFRWFMNIVLTKEPWVTENDLTYWEALEII